jgi:SOS response regulatory protein OraA/RecX
LGPFGGIAILKQSGDVRQIGTPELCNQRPVLVSNGEDAESYPQLPRRMPRGYLMTRRNSIVLPKDLTYLETIATTIATPLPKEQPINPIRNISLTFTRVYNQDRLFSELDEKLGEFECNETVTEEKIDSILPMIENLKLSSDHRLECDFRIRSLKNKFVSPIVVKQNLQKIVITGDQILETINQAKDIEEIKAALIELHEKEYINLGREGRLSVVKQLIQSKRIYQTEQELEDNLQTKAKYMNHILDIINGVTDKVEFDQLLEDMKLPLYLSLSTEVKEIIAEHLLHQNTTYISVSSLANAIEKVYETMDIISATLSMDNPSERKLIMSEG